MTVVFLMTSNESSRFDYLTWTLFSLSFPFTLPFPWTEAEAREAARIKELPEWEQFLLKRRPIIALDGYVPNSVVRATIGFVKPKSPEPEWKLKPVGCMESPVLVLYVLGKDAYISLSFDGSFQHISSCF